MIKNVVVDPRFPTDYPHKGSYVVNEWETGVIPNPRYLDLYPSFDTIEIIAH